MSKSNPELKTSKVEKKNIMNTKAIFAQVRIYSRRSVYFKIVVNKVYTFLSIDFARLEIMHIYKAEDNICSVQNNIFDRNRERLMSPTSNQV